MSRGARKISKSGIYHVMLRGINRQQIFYDEEDNRYFISLLSKYKKICEYQLYAYCLMGNHVHLLINAGEEAPGTIFRRICTAFVSWYNFKYERVGHLFQDRYKSEPVEDDTYFLTVLRYILRNPVKAGMCKEVESYAYSSAGEYFSDILGITDTEFAKSLIGTDKLKKFISENCDDNCLDIQPPSHRITDSAAQKLIIEVLGTISPEAGKAKDRRELNASIVSLLDDGISIRQLSRLTGLSKKLIESRR